MKSDSIQRSVSVNKNTRVIGDVPSIGRVSRMPGIHTDQQPSGKRGDRPAVSKSGIRRKRNSLVRWVFILLFISLIGVGSAGVWIYFYQDEILTVDREVPEITLKKQSITQFNPPTRQDAIEMVKRGLIVRELDEIAHYFNPGKTSPETIAAFLADLEENDGRLGTYESLGSLNTSQLQIEGVGVSFNGPDGEQKRLALLTPDSTGQWKIDFDAFARTADPSWEEFLTEQSDAAEVRVIAAQGVYYQGAFRDNQEWICYSMESPDRPELMHGYCKVGSPQSLAMHHLFANGAKEVRVTLKLRRVEFAHPHQFEIARVYAQDWVMPATAYDEAF